MIFIDRSKAKKPEILEKDSNIEHEKAHKHYVTDGKEKAFDHKLFKKPEVKEALIKLFNGKCAYCESKINKTAPIDKEHFRPKTSIKNKETGNSIRGYYWLAADWDNLLSACAHCNRTGTHETDLGEKFVSGKLDYFPLFDESKRASYGNDLKEEEKVRLLINPCIDKPETMIRYNEDGEIFPIEGINIRKEKMVKTSVETFGLHRGDLHKDRREKWKGVQIQIVRIKKAYHNYIKYSDIDFLDTLKEEFELLKIYKSIDNEHLGVVRFVMRQELLELRKILIAIKQK
ncbi:hypothetical protein [Dokdonia sp.]|uniref:hypothetical protein n=1 Tax=Dokdonia sp. TaxID=2024995 RepID=UPI003266EEE4